MDAQVTFIGTFRVPDMAAWLPAIARMSQFVRENAPRIRSFHAFATADGTEGTVIYVHPDADSLDQHLAAAAELIREGQDMVEVLRIDLLGSPNPGTVERMRGLGVPVSLKRHVVGFER